MATFEQELKRLHRPVMRLVNLSLFLKPPHVRGGENFVLDGPNLVVGNHIGSYKDIALLFRIMPRQVYFTANREIFDSREFSELVRRHLARHLGRLGPFVHLLLRPWYAYFVQFISSNIAKVGSIPVSFDGNRRDTIHLIQKYLRLNRAVVALQGRGSLDDRDTNPYRKPFRRGVAYMAYNLQAEGIAVPVTPMSIFGTHILWSVPAKIRVNVGKPMFIRDHWSGDLGPTVESFRLALQAEVDRLLRDSLRWRL